MLIQLAASTTGSGFAGSSPHNKKDWPRSPVLHLLMEIGAVDQPPQAVLTRAASPGI
jgi:hypothetical protein